MEILQNKDSFVNIKQAITEQPDVKWIAEKNGKKKMRKYEEFP